MISKVQSDKAKKWITAFQSLFVNFVIKWFKQIETFSFVGHIIMSTLQLTITKPLISYS